MSNPVNPAAVASAAQSGLRQAAVNAVKQSGKPLSHRGLVGLFTLGAAIVSGMMIRDCFQGSAVKREESRDQLREARDLRYAQWGWGHWSGQPGMDNFAHKLYGLVQYGPYSLRQTFQDWGVNIRSFFSDVMWPNLIPMGVTLAGLYGTVGAKAVHKPFVAAGRWLFSGPVSQPLKDLGGFLAKGTGTILKTVLGGAFSWCTQSLTHLGIAGGGLFLGAYFLKRFNDAATNDGQEAFFRDAWVRPGNDVY